MHLGQTHSYFAILGILFLSASVSTLNAQNSKTGLIAFTTNRDEDNTEIYVMNLDGGAVRNLTQSPGSDWSPAWSPDGTHIAFESDRDGNIEIYIMNADGGNPRNLTRHPATDVDPTWSPDGKQIAFYSRRGHEEGESGIYIMDADGKNPRLLVDRADDPAWSPDGRQIAFASWRDGNTAEIYTIDIASGNLRRLTRRFADDWNPAWSPDGQYIAFQSNPNGRDEIYRMNADGGNILNLTNHEALDGDAAWSPDGKQIAFWSDRNGSSSIYIMNANGTNPRRLTLPHRGWDMKPAWFAPGFARAVSASGKRIFTWGAVKQGMRY